jgi:phage internal scaffolding protein
MEIKMSEFVTAYGPKNKVVVDFSKSKSRTRQAHKDECDINRIINKYQRTGTLSWTNKYAAKYGDVTSTDFQSAMDTLIQTQEMFEELPSTIRNRFQNNPSQFLDYVQDANNLEEMYELGLAIRPKQKPLDEVQPEPQPE